jgi:hypothetical protein
MQSNLTERIQHRNPLPGENQGGHYLSLSLGTLGLLAQGFSFLVAYLLAF